MRKLLALLILLAAPSWAATYYVDNCDVTGNDGNNGTSTSTPWLTINKVNTSSFSAGDSILFKKDCTWREQLTVPSSGSSGNPITFGAYGSGADPIINGTDDVKGLIWTEVPGDITDTGTIAADAQDASEYTTTYLTGTYGDIGQGYGANTTGWVFQGMAVPNAAIVTAASIDFVASQSFAVDTCNVTIRAQTADAPSDFANQADFDARKVSVTTAHVHWSAIPGWTSGVTYTTPDITDVIKEVVDRPGWTNGNNITIFIFDDTSTETAKRRVSMRGDGNTTNLAILSVTYSGGSTNQWQAAVTTEPKQVFFDGTRGTLVASVALVNGTGKWFWAANVLTVYSTADPSGAFTTLEAGARTLCITASDKSYVTIDGLDCTKSDLDGIYFVLSTAIRYGWTVQNCDISKCYRKALYGTGTATYYSSGIRFHDNAISSIGGYTAGTGGLSSSGGITVGYADDFKVYNNTLDFDNQPTSGYAMAVTLKHSSNSDTGSEFYNNSITGTIYGTTQNSALDMEAVYYIDVYNNLITAGVKKGIWLDATGEGDPDGPEHCNFHHNRIVLGTTGKYGVHTEWSPNNLWLGNIIDMRGCSAFKNAVFFTSGSDHTLFYNNTILAAGAGDNLLRIGMTSDEVGYDQSYSEFKNNILYYTGAAADSIISVEDGNDPHVTTGIVFDHNHYVDPDWTNCIDWFGTLYASIAAWNSAVPAQEAHYITGDPLFTNAVGGDFTLQAGSPCIEKGLNLGATYLEQLLAGSTWPAAVETMDWHKTGGAPDVGAYGYRKVIW